MNKKICPKYKAAYIQGLVASGDLNTSDAELYLSNAFKIGEDKSDLEKSVGEIIRCDGEHCQWWVKAGAKSGCGVQNVEQSPPQYP